MSLVVIGLNHRTAPLDLLERMSIDDSRLTKALADLVERPHVTEAVILSTCNRTEVYAYVEKFHGAYQDVREFLSANVPTARVLRRPSLRALRPRNGPSPVPRRVGARLGRRW